MSTPTETPPGIINWILKIPSAVVYLFFLLKYWIRQRRNAIQNYTTIAAATPIMELPDSIMCDILSRLPLNSIFICRRVCKVWRNLLLDPSFAKLHLSRSPLSLFFYRNGCKCNTNPLAHFNRTSLNLFLNRLAYKSGPPSPIKRSPLSLLFNRNRCSPSHFEIFEIDDPRLVAPCKTTMKFRTATHFPRRRYTEVKASCNGSFVVLNYEQPDAEIIVVCNPLRGQHLVLPKPPKKSFDGPSSLVQHFGLGHTPSTRQYKVLRLSPTRYSDRLGGHIYTIGIDDEWRCIGEIGRINAANYVSHLVFLNGALHWVTGTKNSPLIYCFDIEKEQFVSFPLPFLEKKESRNISFGVVDNMMYIGTKSLSLDNPTWRFWVLKDYRDYGSWSLEWIIEVQALGPKFAGAAEPLKMLKDGSLLIMFTEYIVHEMDTETALALFNPHTELLKEIKYGSKILLACWALHVLIYQASSPQWML